MSKSGSDFVCCSSSNIEDSADNVNNSTTPFPIDNWDAEGGDDVEQPNDNVDVFNQDIAIEHVSYMDDTVLLELPKFSKGFKRSDFDAFVRNYVGEENIERLENYQYPNLWMMVLKNREARENCLRLWKTKIKNKTCWIKPYHDYELRGCLHWLPHFIPDDDVKRQLSQFGDVLLLENLVHDYWTDGIKSEVKYFGIRLKDGMVKDDMPHFLKFGGYRTLVIVRGRKPACFHCREFGHTKKDCEKYKEKLDEYCKNPEAKKPRTKPRGKRHRPETGARSHIEDTTHQSVTNSTVKFCPKRTYSDRKLAVDKKKPEIQAILRSLLEWKEGIKEMVEQTLKKIEENSGINLTPTVMTEYEEKEESNDLAFEIISKLLDETKQNTFEMVEETLNNLKNIVAEYFGLDSNETLEKLISNFETRKEEILGPKEVVKYMEEQLSHYI